MHKDASTDYTNLHTNRQAHALAHLCTQHSLTAEHAHAHHMKNTYRVCYEIDRNPEQARTHTDTYAITHTHTHKDTIGCNTDCTNLHTNACARTPAHGETQTERVRDQKMNKHSCVQDNPF